MKNWFDEENFWLNFYDWMFPAASFAEAKEQVVDVIALSGCNGGEVLDLCCGPGRHSVPLSKHGFQVTGVDLQKVLLDKACDYAKTENIDRATVSWIEENMLSFVQPDKFDLAVSMFSSFGYFGDLADDIQVLKNVYESLKTGGSFVLDIRGKEIHAKANVTSFSQEMPNGDIILHRTKVLDGWDRSVSDWYLIRDGVAQQYEMRFNLYSAREIKMALENVGFSEIGIFGNLKGAPYDQDAQRLVVVARKAS